MSGKAVRTSNVAEVTGAPSEILWAGRPSQVVNATTYAICILLAMLVFPLFIAAWRWLKVRCEAYELSTERLLLRRGVLNRVVDNVELSRVKDITLQRPLWQRLFHLGSLQLVTSDHSMPLVQLQAIRNPEDVMHVIRDLVDRARLAKGVREIDN